MWSRAVDPLKHLEPEEAEAYVKSIGRQIGEKDAGVVAGAILQLLTAGQTCKA